MLRTAYKLAYDGRGDIPPVICEVEITDTEGTSWQVAKKELRGWYINKAAMLRKVTEKEYFANS